jgi:hypothetical protein
VGARGFPRTMEREERSHGVAIIGAIQRGAMPTKRRPDRVQFEDHDNSVAGAALAIRSPDSPEV